MLRRVWGDRMLCWITVLALAASTAVFLLVAVAGKPSDQGMVVVALWAALIALNLIAALLAVRLWRSFAAGEVLKGIWGKLALGLLLWSLGTTVWGFSDVVRGQFAAYQLLSDGLYLAGYEMIILALFQRYRSLEMTLRRRRGIIVLAIIAPPTLLVSLSAVSPAVLPRDLPELILGVLYLLVDLHVAFLALLNLLLVFDGLLATSWFFIGAGFLAGFVSDVLYLYYAPPFDPGSDPLLGVIVALYFLGGGLLAAGVYAEARLHRVA